MCCQIPGVCEVSKVACRRDSRTFALNNTTDEMEEKEEKEEDDEDEK